MNALVLVCLAFAVAFAGLAVLKDEPVILLGTMFCVVLAAWAKDPDPGLLVTCTNSEDVVIKTMTGRVTTYKGSNYVSNDTETYIIPPGTTCVESSLSPQPPR